MDTIYEVIKICLTEAFMISLPVVLTALVVGTMVSLFQTLTSIQEQTLSFVPKLLACGACIWFMAPWMLNRLAILFELMLTKAGHFNP